MSDWRTVRIGDLGRVVTGKTPSSSQPEMFDGEIPFITPSDMFDDRRHIPTERFVSSAWDSKQRTLLPEGAICVVCIGATIGKICMTSRPSQTNQQLNSVVVDPARFDPRFVYYALRTLGEELKARAAGAATPILNKSAFSDVTITAPSLVTQRRIGEILGAYDDLIEVNRRRITVLEEMARGLFTEWFMRLRFPGHEVVAFEDTPDGPLPAGWAIETLGALADIQWGDTSTTKKSYTPSGFRAYSASGPDGFMPTFDYDRVGVVLSAIGAQCGKIWLARGQWSCIKNTMRFWGCTDSVSTEYLYLALADPKKWPKRGAAQPFVSLGDARRIKILRPDRTTSVRFEACVAPMLQLADFLSMQNENLSAARDLLLPRLISGELSVTQAERVLEAA